MVGAFAAFAGGVWAAATYFRPSEPPITQVACHCHYHTPPAAGEGAALPSATGLGSFVAGASLGFAAGVACCAFLLGVRTPVQLGEVVCHRRRALGAPTRPAAGEATPAALREARDAGVRR